MQKKYNTKTSQAIQAYIGIQNEKCFCVADVVAYLEKQDVQMNLTTVYRNLDRLVEQDQLIKFKTPNSDTYLYRIAKANGSCREHLHMQCRECGIILHLENALMDKIVKSLKSQYGFTLECENSSLSGICEECKMMIK